MSNYGRDCGSFVAFTRALKVVKMWLNGGKTESPPATGEDWQQIALSDQSTTTGAITTINTLTSTPSLIAFRHHFTCRIILFAGNNREHLNIVAFATGPPEPAAQQTSDVNFSE